MTCKTAGLLIASDIMGNCALGINNTHKTIEIARGEAECYFNCVVCTINPNSKFFQFSIVLFVLLILINHNSKFFQF